MEWEEMSRRVPFGRHGSDPEVPAVSPAGDTAVNGIFVTFGRLGLDGWSPCPRWETRLGQEVKLKP